jgi:hypothetical protein
MRKLAPPAVLIVLALIAAGAWFEPTHIVRGWLRGEPTYQSRPAAWWRERLVSQEPADQAEYPRRLQAGGADAVPVLTDLLRAPEAEVRWRAADILGKIGPAAAPASAQLAAALHDGDSHVRTVAAQALGEIGPKGVDPAVVPGLVELLSTGDRLPALRALASIGPAAAPAISEIARVLREDPDATTRWNAARTLGKIGPAAKTAIPALVQAMGDDPDALVREHAAEALGDIGPDAAEAVADLAKACKDPSHKVRRDAVRSLGQIGAPAKAALPQVEALLKDPEAIVREAAETAKRKITGG